MLNLKPIPKVSLHLARHPPWKQPSTSSQVDHHGPAVGRQVIAVAGTGC
jgi:hypothetical protein